MTRAQPWITIVPEAAFVYAIDVPPADTTKPTRTVADSLTQMTEMVLPQHTNALGTAFGGTVMGWVDICAAIAAGRHCGRVSVTAAIDELVFRAPIKQGDVVVLTAQMNAAFRTSMEVGVHVEVEDAATRTRTICADALLTFVNIDDDGKPMPVPALLCESEEERARAEAALKRKQQRIANKRA